MNRCIIQSSQGFQGNLDHRMQMTAFHEGPCHDLLRYLTHAILTRNWLLTRTCCVLDDHVWPCMYAFLLNFKLPLVHDGVVSDTMLPTTTRMERLKEPADRTAQSSPWTQFLMHVFSCGSVDTMKVTRRMLGRSGGGQSKRMGGRSEWRRWSATRRAHHGLTWQHGIQGDGPGCDSAPSRDSVYRVRASLLHVFVTGPPDRGWHLSPHSQKPATSSSRPDIPTSAGDQRSPK